jgi:hypothetical protein
VELLLVSRERDVLKEALDESKSTVAGLQDQIGKFGVKNEEKASKQRRKDWNKAAEKSSNQLDRSRGRNLGE